MSCRFMEGGGPSIINRVDRQRAVTVFANLEKKPMGQAMAELDGITAGVLPSDFTASYKGQANIMQESFQYLLFAILLGVIMAYMVLAAQFESFIHPFTVLLSLPLSFIGAFGALLDHGEDPQRVQLYRPHPPDGAREEECHSARGLHQYPEGPGG